MPDYPTTPPAASSPIANETRPDFARRAQLLTTLDTIPREDLPGGEARELLAKLIRAGYVDNLYMPFGADYWNISWALRPSFADPRQRVSAFVAEEHEKRGKRGKQCGDA